MWARALIRKGFPVGPSSGLNYLAAMMAAARLGHEAHIVTVFPDQMGALFDRVIRQALIDIGRTTQYSQDLTRFFMESTDLVVPPLSGTECADPIHSLIEPVASLVRMALPMKRRREDKPIRGISPVAERDRLLDC